MAALAGVPKAVIDSARKYLQILESTRRDSGVSTPSPQLGLFEVTAPNPVIEEIRAVDPDGLSAREALELLYKLHRSLAKD